MAYKILVVDDTAFMAMVITKTLQTKGYATVTASSGEEALEYLKTEKPDLILLDVVMTGISGYDVLQALRNDLRYNLIPIIMLTGQTEEEDKLKGLEMGADDYIVKPFNNRELLARVQNTLVRLERSRGVNPLTGLRGNNDIELALSARLAEGGAFAVLYFDLNSFKPYNDIYGFGNGDLAIQMTADVITEAVVQLGAPSDFVGHVGGDDFVVITESNRAIPVTERIIDQFDKRVPDLYTPEDAANGYITAKDRDGNERQFILLGLSVAVVFSERHPVSDTRQLAEAAAVLKKEAKTVAGGKSAYVY